jgi:hypothetical protein
MRLSVPLSVILLEPIEKMVAADGFEPPTKGL